MKKLLILLAIFCSIFSTTLAQTDNLTIGQVKQIIEKLGGYEKALELIKEEPKWTEKNGIISFVVTSDGTSGRRWIARLRTNGAIISDEAKKVLCSESFKASKATYKVVVIRTNKWSDNQRITKEIEKEKEYFMAPNIELACLIREKFSDDELKAMNLSWIMIMQEVKISEKERFLLYISSQSEEGPFMDTSDYDPDGKWRQNGGFAFVAEVSELKKQN